MRHIWEWIRDIEWFWIFCIGVHAVLIVLSLLMLAIAIYAAYHNIPCKRYDTILIGGFPYQMCAEYGTK